jgi:ubiquinone/menaquinone biosynthesis C-methylase UbiE
MLKKDINETRKSSFDEIAKKYDEEIPQHIREHFCVKKVSFMVQKLEENKRRDSCAEMRGLDCGCGTGWHIKRFYEKGFIVDGIDSSEKMIHEARKNNNKANFLVCSADNISLVDKTYEFIYFINVLHHLPSREAQQNALREAHRLLKTGGFLFIHEVNEELFLFRFYMKYIFPLTNKIHRCERAEKYWSIKEILGFIKDDWLLYGIEYFTFLPNIIPTFVFPFLKEIEASLEELTQYKVGAHWLMTLKKTG